jgi:large repetitive protein
MTNYTWAVSTGGSIISGNGTYQIQVLWNTTGAQSVQVNYTGTSGCQAATPTTYPVMVNSLPAAAGAITGTHSLCAGENGIAYSVPSITGAITYLWNLPAGATIASGSGTNSITVNFASNSSSGNITVYGNNLCGNGTLSPNFSVTINPIPDAPVVTNTGTTLYSSAANGNQWYFQGTLISGATSQTYAATQDGYYWSVVTLNGCSSDTSNHKLILVTGIENPSNTGITIYPVPSDGKFTVSFSGSSNETYTISVINSLGVKIFEDAKVMVNVSGIRVIDLRPVSNGVYTVIVENSSKQVVKKIIVSR